MIVRHPSSSLSQALALVLAAGALAGTASAQTERRWRNPANGDWGTVSNWVSNLPPSSFETAYFGLNASATTYTVTSAVNRTTAGFNVNNQRPTFFFGSAGSPATYTVNSFVTIGGTNSPAATLARGNVVAPANVMVGRNAGQPGTLTISGPESFWSGIDTIGQAAAGEVNVINGGTLASSRPLFLGFATGASGLLRVDGANGPSRAQILGNGFVVLGTDGTGRIELLNGGQMSVNNEQFYVGDRGNASLLISGAGSSLTLPFQLRLAENAPSVATATVQAGGSITAQGVEIGQRGQATLIVKDAGSQVVTNFSGIGLNGNGTLEIRDGALYRVTSGELNVGRSNGATGSVLISGPGSELDFQGWVRVGDNGGANGVLTIENGATPTLGNPLMIGHQPGSNGSLVVRGAGTVLNSTGAVIVGQAGVGSFEASDFGGVIANAIVVGPQSTATFRSGAFGECTGVFIIAGTGSEAVIDGPDSIVFAQSRVEPGFNNPGSEGILTLRNGGRIVSTDYINHGRFGTVRGTGFVDGQWSAQGIVSPGENGPGVLIAEQNLLFLATARTILDIAGPTPGSQHDLLAVAGNASLNGTIEISAAPGFDPPVGSTYDVMTYSSRSGPGFASVVSAALPAGKAFLVNTLPDRVRVEVGGVQSITPSAASVSTYTGFTPVVRLSASVLGSGGTSTIDATSTAEYIVDDPQILQVTSPGNLRALAAGSTNLRIRFAGLEAVVPVTVNAVNLPPTLSPGLDGTWYDLSFPKFSNLTPYRTIFPSKVGFDGADRFEAVGIVFTGLVNVPAAGDYRFVLGSDDGSRLFVNGQRVINNDGIHGGRDYEAVLSLPAGPADIRVEYYERGGGEGVRLRWERLGGFSLRDVEGVDWAGNAVSAAYYALAFPNLNTLTLNWDDFVPSEQTVYSAFSDGDPNTRPSFGFPRSESGTTVGIRTSGFFFAPESGPITFNMQADDAAQMRINGSIILQSPLRNFNQAVSQTINLPAGFHAIEVDAHNEGGFWGLLISANGSGFVNQILDQASLFRGEIPPPCPADFDSDGFVDFFDFDFYVACFEDANACPPGKSADFDADGFVDFFDFDAFVAAFELGC